jgi:DNA polymerase I-like protein with 3'-5' exonuclease and polymerase domains
MNINYIVDPAEYTRAIEVLTGYKKLCLDFETTGLQASIAKPRLLQLCDSDPTVEDRTVYVFDLFKVPADAALKDLIESREMLIGQNLNFDLQFLFTLGIDFKGKIFDTYVAERILRAGFKEKRISPVAQKIYFVDVSCSLKSIALRRLELELDKEQRRTDWSQPDLTLEQITYAATDVDILPRIAVDQLEELREESLTPIYSIESRCIRPVALMCYNGFGVDVTKLKELRVNLEQDLKDKTEQFISGLDAQLPEDQKLPRDAEGLIATGKKPKKEFNPGSPVQVIAAFTACGIEVPKDTITGKPTLNQIALSEFDSEDPTIALYRERAKIETRLEHISKLINNVNPVTHRIHSSYNQVGANSGRFTCSGAPKTKAKENKSVFAVNMQQIPRSSDFRACFTAAPGYALVIADYNQMELRLLAELANIPQMQEAYNKDIDLHTLTAALMNNCPISEVTKAQRQMAKGANFGIIFGIGFKKFKTYAASSFGLHLSLSESKILHSKFHSAYPRLREWHMERSALVQDGWCYTRTAMGRRRLLSYDDCKMTTAANTIIQGSGADILKVALGELGPDLNQDVRLVAVVHDEIVLEVKESLSKQWEIKLPEIMTRAGSTVFKKTKLTAEPGVGPDWSSK